MKQKQIEVVIVEPHRVPRRCTIENTTEAMQRIVGGKIEKISSPNGLDIVRNEEGKLLGLPLNRALIVDAQIIDIIAGAFCVCSSEQEHFASLTEEQIEQTIKRYYFGEDFVAFGCQLLTVPRQSRNNR